MNKNRDENTPQRVKSVDRALDLFELLSGRNQELTHSELADELAIPKSSLSQLLGNLIYRGYVSFDAQTQRYRLGEAFIRISQHSVAQQKLAEIAIPVLEYLKDVTGESSMIQELIGWEGIVTASIMGDQNLVTHMRVDERAPLHTLSGGKVLLASMSDAEIAEYCRFVEFDQITEKSIRNEEELRKDLSAVRKTGYAYSLQEHTVGVDGIGAPVTLETGVVVAGISVVMPTIRHTNETANHIKAAMKTAQRRLTSLLSGMSITASESPQAL